MVWALSAALAAGIVRREEWLATAFLVLWFAAGRDGRTRPARVTLILLCLLLYGYGFHTSGEYDSRTAEVDTVSVVGNPVLVEGVVAGYPAWSRGGVRFDFDTYINGTRQRLRIKATAFDIASGDRLQMWVQLDPPSRMRRSEYLRGRGATGSGTAKVYGRIEVGSPGALWLAHDHVRRVLVRGCGYSGGLPVALVLGERGYLDRSTRDAFQRLGIAHLLALSGFHLGFIAIALLTLMQRAGIRSGLILGGCLSFYVGIVGFILSLYRALLMVILLLVARRVRRPMRPVDALITAFLLMLLVYPFALYSLGFQLSFLATFAVLVCVERFPHQCAATRARRIVRGLGSTMWVSAVVQVWVAPIILRTFGGISLVAPVATVLFTLPVMVVLALGIVATVIASIRWEIGLYVFPFLSWASRAFEDMLEIAVAWSPPLFEWSSPHPIPFYIGLAAASGLWKRNLWITATGVLVAAASCVIPW
jgi:ComEC/Rec2-related protein